MDIEEEVFSARLGISQNMNEASLSDTILYTRREGPQAMRSPSSMAIWPNWVENGLFICTILTRIRSIISILWMESKLI